MKLLDVEEHPILFVVVVGVFMGGVSHLLRLFLETRIRFKTHGDKEVVIYFVYFSTACIFLSWACYFLGQISPIVKPEW